LEDLLVRNPLAGFQLAQAHIDGTRCVRTIWSPTAERNLGAIWEYVAQDNIDAADRMVERLRVAANNLIDYPRMGRTGRSHGRAN
jgi:plasmid stabilization system protein ParE